MRRVLQFFRTEFSRGVINRTTIPRITCRYHIIRHVNNDWRRVQVETYTFLRLFMNLTKFAAISSLRTVIKGLQLKAIQQLCRIFIRTNKRC